MKKKTVSGVWFGLVILRCLLWCVCFLDGVCFVVFLVQMLGVKNHALLLAGTKDRKPKKKTLKNLRKNLE